MSRPSIRLICGGLHGRLRPPLLLLLLHEPPHYPQMGFSYPCCAVQLLFSCVAFLLF